jgi:replicative DNA helicase
MRSTRQYDSLRHELKLIYEELRGFAGEKLIPVWTASQSNKEGANSEVVDLGNMSEAYGKAMVADVVISLSRKAHEKSDGFGRLFVAKNRAGRDGIVYPIKIDTARSKFEIYGRASSPEETVKEDEKGFKKRLQEKWREIKSDPLLKKDDEDDGNKGSGE